MHIQLRSFSQLDGTRCGAHVCVYTVTPNHTYQVLFEKAVAGRSFIECDSALLKAGRYVRISIFRADEARQVPILISEKTYFLTVDLSAESEVVIPD